MRDQWRTSTFILSILILTICFIHCGPEKKVKLISPIDNPDVHYKLGMAKLEALEIEAAMMEFQRAIELDSKFSPAYSGIGVALAMNGEEEDAYEQLRMAKREAKFDEEKLIYHTAAIRIETTLRGEDWLNHSKEHYQEGIGLRGNHSELIFFYALANEEAHEYETAMSLYREVLELNEGRITEADEHWNKIQRALRAQPGSTYGQEMALKDEITRGELAVLLLEELDLNRLFETALSRIEPNEISEIPYDIQNHPFKNAILKVLGWDLRGLRVSDNLFHPDNSVMRGEFAMLVEDIVIKMSGDQKLATRYIQEGESPFEDIDNTSPYYNAVVVTTSKDLLEPDSPSIFNVKGHVTGSDVLLAMRRLREHQF